MGSASIVYIPRPPTCRAQEKAMTIILSRVDEIANEAARKMKKKSETSGGEENGKGKRPNPPS